MKYLHLAAICIMIAIASGCKKDNTEPFDSNDVYIAGTTYASNGREVATLWSNGVAQHLSDGSENAYANSVFVDGQDVYVGGSNDDNAMIWKNGVAQQIDEGSRIASLYISDGDVYATGNIADHRPGLWINGTAQALSTPDNSSNYASSIFVSGTDVYICGYMRQNNSTHAVYWKNGTLNILANNAQATSIFVFGSDVYIGGTIWNGQQTAVATVWKNGVATALTTGIYDAFTTDVYVANNTVYVAGSERNASNLSLSKLWQNGTPTTLSEDGVWAGGYSVYVVGNDVYVAGSTNTTNREGDSVCTLWKNGIPQYLNKDNRNGWGSAIFIKNK